MSDILPLGDGFAATTERNPEGTWSALDSPSLIGDDADTLSTGFGHVYDAAGGRPEECILATYRESYWSLDHPARERFRARVVLNVARRLAHWNDDAIWDEIARLDEWFPPTPDSLVGRAHRPAFHDHRSTAMPGPALVLPTVADACEHRLKIPRRDTMTDQVTTNAVCRCGNSFGERVFTDVGHYPFRCPSCGRTLSFAVSRDARGKLLYEISNPR